MPRKVHYINNKHFLEAIKKHRELANQAEQLDKPPPVISKYLGECIIELTNRIARKPNFSGYMFLDDMKGDAIETCIKYMHNFNPDKSDNPFSYFTTIIHNAFVQRIEKEKKQLATRHLALTNSMIMNDLANIPDKDGSKLITLNIDTEYMNEFMEDFERRQEQKKLAQKKNNAKKGINKFIKE